MKSPGVDEIIARVKGLKDDPKAILIILAVVLLLDVAFILRGQVVSLGNMFKEARTLKTNITSAHDDAKFFTTYQNKVKDLKNELEGLNKKVVAEEDLPNSMESISKYADNSVVRILKIRPIADIASAKAVTSKSQENFIRQKVTISAKCGFHQLGRFMALLENAPVFFDIKSIEIQTDQQEYLKHLVTIILEVVLKKA